MRKTPVEQKQESKEREVQKRAHRKEVLKTAEELAAGNLNTLLDIVRKNLNYKKKKFEIYKNMNVEDILAGGETRYLCRRSAMEAEIKSLENTSNLPMVYEKESERILNPTPTPGRKTTGASKGD